MANHLPGNPHARRVDNATNQAAGDVLTDAIMAVAFELRTANLIAMAAADHAAEAGLGKDYADGQRRVDLNRIKERIGHKR